MTSTTQEPTGSLREAGRARRTTAAERAGAAIRELIRAGVFAPLEKLPGERDLADMVKVSRTALREALAALQDEGLVESSPWRGWFVCGAELNERVQLDSFTDMARARGLVPGARVLRALTRTVTYEEATALSLAPGAAVFEIHRLRTLDAVPTCVNVSVVPLCRAAGVDQLDFRDSSMYAALEVHCRVRVVRCDYVVHAELAGGEEATHLGVEPGAAVLVGEEVAYDAAGTPIVLARTTWRAESYRFRATLYRPATATTP